MPGRLDGKIALVSGSTQGFGKGILDLFVKEGAQVLGLDLQATDGPVQGYSEQQAYQIKANVAEEDSWTKAVRHMNHLCPVPDPKARSGGVSSFNGVSQYLLRRRQRGAMLRKHNRPSSL